MHQLNDTVLDLHLLEQVSTCCTMLLHKRILQRRESCRFVEEGSGKSQFAHIMYERCQRDRRLLLLRVQQICRQLLSKQPDMHSMFVKCWIISLQVRQETAQAAC